MGLLPIALPFFSRCSKGAAGFGASDVASGYGGGRRRLFPRWSCERSLHVGTGESSSLLSCCFCFCSFFYAEKFLFPTQQNYVCSSLVVDREHPEHVPGIISGYTSRSCHICDGKRRTLLLERMISHACDGKRTKAVVRAYGACKHRARRW